jgi:hypothetical protein
VINQPTYQQQLYWIANRVIRGYQRFVSVGKYTWREAIIRSLRPTAFDDEGLDSVEAEIQRLLTMPAARRGPLSDVFAPEIKGEKKSPLPSNGRRVIRKGETFS